MLLRLPLPLHLPRRNEHHQPLLHNSVPPKRFNYHIFSHPQSTSPTVPVLRATYPVDLSSPSSFSEDEQDVELGRLLSLLPEEMRRRVSDHPELQQLMEVVMDLGRKPLARFPSGDFVISEYPITVQDIQHATAQVGDFAVDNRAGISRTLHRISAIRNRKGTIIGLTCRVGRAISGSAKLLQDLVQDGASLLLIGPPGVGKTTIIREVARMLANDYKKRVMIVDTSNEIGGDGDIPHSGIGSARRMQVPNSDMQHKVLIEAVENHMPQVIVIDEIGTKLEAMAASTIAQRGIQLVATAHGITIENLIMNPSLEMLVGGIQSVTLGDEEASRRGVQKTVLERKGPSTFSCAVEIISKTQLRIHRSLEATVDAILSGRVPNVEVRKMKSQEQEEILQKGPVIDSPLENGGEIILKDAPGRADVQTRQDESPLMSPIDMLEDSWEHRLPLRLFCYG
ncbi:protein SEEDLING PLASTID DEVELOPMENT 1 isoform X3 [Vicia villosa]|nr:protein SEEDLING PLASTID DEVELOPMENT 1 isoform X3 [Vicia villosa]